MRLRCAKNKRCGGTLLACLSTGGTKGFSVIEFVGVLAILAILAAALAPVAVRKSDKGAIAKEQSAVLSISNGLTTQIIRNKTIPDDTTWASAAATWMTLPPTQIATNSRGFARAFVMDPNGWPGGYAQTASGTNQRPASGRAMIVSTIAKDLPISSGWLSGSATAFNDIWNTPPLAKPSMWSWAGSGEDLTIQRFTTDSLFHRVILANRDSSTQPGFTVDSTDVASKTAVAHNGTGLDSYYLDGTVVSLWVDTTLTNSFVLTSDISFTFSGGMWRAQLAGGGASNGGTATNFAAFADQFTKTASSNNKGTDPRGVMTAFASFMYTYTIWANECPHFQTTASGYPQTADWAILNQIESMIDADTGKTAAAGLLK
jgi:type II secretory pathway pseudopilin PulG